MKKDYILIGVISLFVAMGVIYGFVVIGLPRDSRGMRFDAIRVNNLSSIKNRIDSYASQNKRLPQSIRQAVATDSYVKILDPETDKPYEYIITDTDSYRLCATFDTDNTRRDMPQIDYYSPSEFRHSKGYNCFPFTVNLGTNYNYFSPTITPLIVEAVSPTDVTKYFTDKNIESVKLDEYTLIDQSSEFPEGFFTANENEYGLINYRSHPIPVSVHVSFIRPVKLASLTNSFSACSKGDCYKWTAVGTTDSGENISLSENMMISDTNLQPKLNITSEKSFTNITIRVFNIYDKSNHIKWKKIKFIYK